MNDVLIDILGPVVGAVVGYFLGNIPAARKKLRGGLKRMVAAADHVRRFLLARKKTRLHARAAFMSRRRNIALAVLELTLFRWYEKNPDLLPHIQSVHENHSNERVKTAAYKLLYDNKKALELEIGDIVELRDKQTWHVLFIYRRDDDFVDVLLEATPRAKSSITLHKERTARVARGGWCIVPDCRYCAMGPDLCQEIGYWWWERKKLSAELQQFKSHGVVHSVANTEDADKAFENFQDGEKIGKMYVRTMNPPEILGENDADSSISSVETVGGLKNLAEDGWKFKVLRRDYGYDEPRINVFECQPPSGADDG